MFSALMQVFATCLILLSGTCNLPPADARITKIELSQVESPTFEGREFGKVGQYEKISGRLFGEVDPSAAENTRIVNLDKAPRNTAGRVAYNTDFVILRPVDPSKGNQTLFYGVLNRGNKIDLVLLNNVAYGKTTNTPKSADDAGNGFLMRALLVALRDWVYTGTPPPKSQIPTRKEGTLVTVAESLKGFPPIPGVTHVGRLNPTFVKTTTSPATQYTNLVAKTDADGNDLAGIRVPDIAVPLGTHTGWGVRADVPTEMRQMCGNWGQFIPFAKTKTEREKTGDPRLSVAERYPTKQAYVEKIEQTVKALQGQGLLLAEDAAAYIADAERKAPVQN